MEQQALAALESVRPHVSDEDLSYLEGTAAAEDWEDLLNMATAFAASYGISLPPAAA